MLIIYHNVYDMSSLLLALSLPGAQYFLAPMTSRYYFPAIAVRAQMADQAYFGD